MSKLNVGDKIPSFCLQNQDGKEVCILPEDGKKRIIYFYPKDNTKVCTEEACSFRDWYDEFLDLGFEVIGISGDSVSSHHKFKSQHHLNFELLSDKGGKVRKLFGATTFFGLVPHRSSFAIDENGKVLKRYDAMFDSSEHVDEMIKILKTN